MPVYNRQTLRRRLGQIYLYDTLVGATTSSHNGPSFTLVDKTQADPTASGELLYQRAHARVIGSSGVIQDARVGSFNEASGVFASAVAMVGQFPVSTNYEIHTLISPADKDRALDEVIKDVRIRQEVSIWAISNGNIYSLGPDIEDVLDVRYLTDPTHSLNQGEHQVDWFKVENTGSGVQLRIHPSLAASQMLLLDAITAVSLGSGDLATVNIPNDSWVLYGAAARCYFMLEAKAPAREAGTFAARRKEMALAYSRLAQRFQPQITRRIQLDLPW